MFLIAIKILFDIFFIYLTYSPSFVKRQSVDYECPKRNFSILLNMEKVLLLSHKMYSSGGAESINCCYNSISLFSFYMQSWDQVILMRETQQRETRFYIYLL